MVVSASRARTPLFPKASGNGMPQCYSFVARCPRRPLLFRCICYSEPTKRFRRYHATPAFQYETVTLPCKSHGFITLNIHNATSGKSGAGVILYLPPGPSYIPSTSSAFDDFSELAQSHLSSHVSENAVQESRSQSSSAFARAMAQHCDRTVVQVNYRLSKAHQFPTPIHDVLTGFDYVASKMLPNKGEIGVCGELAGGTLALMLALTETRAELARIACAVVHEPIVDWIIPSTSGEATATNKKRKPALKSSTPSSSGSNMPVSSQEQDTQALTISNLQTLRGMLFHPLKPATYFDPFASPIHFLRTSGATVPRPKGVDDDFATLADLADLTVEDESLVASRTTSPGSSTPPSGSNSSTDEVDTQYEDLAGSLDDLETPPPSSSPYPAISQLQMLNRTIKPRKTRLRYPPPGHSLIIPQIRISAALNSALIPQLEEFTRLLQRAIVSNSPAAKGVKESTITELASAIGRGKGIEEFGALKEAWSEAEARLRFETGSQNRLWNVDGASEAEVETAAQRVGEQFSRMMS